MLTNEVALEIARKELDSAMYVIETNTNPGLRKIAENKSDWLVRLIQMSESYCNFHWTPSCVLMPENALQHADKDSIRCIVIVADRSGSPVIDICTRKKSKLKKQWVWSGHRPADILWWADLPKLPGGY